MLDGYRKVDPPTRKKLPVQADVVELLVDAAYHQGSSLGQQAVADLTLIVFYYLLRIGEYMIKGSRNNTKQTVQFKYEDVSFLQEKLPGSPPLLTSRCLGRTHHDGRRRYVEA